jgi:hypothetical protein
MTWLKSEIINITGEIEVLDAAARWTEQDIENRLHLLPDLLDCVQASLHLPPFARLNPPITYILLLDDFLGNERMSSDKISQFRRYFLTAVTIVLFLT